MDTNNLKSQIASLLPDNMSKLIKAAAHRLSNNAIIDFFFGITGDPDQLQTSDKSSLVNAINEVKSSGGGGGGVDWTTPIDKFFGIWDTATGKIINSKLEETIQGAKLSGRLVANGLIGKNISSNIDGVFNIDLNDLAEHYFLTQTDNVAITFTNMITANQTAVITITLTGTYTFTFPSWLKPLPYNDTYDGAINNEIVINIKRGGSSPLGYYSLTKLS